MMVWVIMHCLAAESNVLEISKGPPQCKVLGVRLHTHDAVFVGTNYCMPTPSTYEVGEDEKECRKHIYLYRAPLA